MTVVRNLVTNDGAVGDFQKVTATLTILAGHNQLTSSTNLWVSGDNGKQIFVGGAGAAGDPLPATLTFVDAKNVTLSVNASTALPTVSQAVSWGTDNAGALNSFNAWATAQTDDVQLTIPAGNYGVLSQVGNSFFWVGGVKNLLVLATGATLSDTGFGVSPFSPTFLLGGQGQQNTVAGQSLIKTVASGAILIPFVTVSDAGKYFAGDWLYISGVDLQDGGYPLNNFYFEYQQIASVDTVAGTITLTAPLKNSYRQTWPNFDAVADGGPASVFLMHSTWNINVEFRGLTIDQVLGTGASGRVISFTNGCSFLGTNGPNITQTKTALVQDSFASDCAVEIDKGLETYTWKNTPVRRFFVQSAGPNIFDVSGTTVSSAVTGTPRVSKFTNCTLASLSVGCFYGRTDQLICSGCAIPTLLASGSQDLGGSGNTGVQNAYTMSGGVIKVPKSGISGPLAWATPGAVCMWGGQRVNQRMFQVIDVTDDANFVYVQTDQTGGFPNVPLDGSSRLIIANHPCIADTFIGCTGDPAAIDFSGQPRGIPLYSQSSRTYSGDTLLPNPSNPPPITLWGNILSATITVSKAYTGTHPTLTLQAFDGPTLQTDNSTGRYTPIVNLKASGQRVITPSGVTGQQSGDSGLALPTPGTPWFSDAAFSGPNISADVSGESSSVWPIVTITFQADQGLGGIVSVAPAARPGRSFNSIVLGRRIIH